MCVLLYVPFFEGFMYLHLQLFRYFRGIDRNYLKVQHFKFAPCKYLLRLKFFYKVSGRTLRDQKHC